MKATYLHTLLEKYQAGTCTAGELALLDEWYDRLGSHRPDEILDPAGETAALLTQLRLRELKMKMAPVKESLPWWRRYQAAALITGILLMAAGAWWSYRHTGTTNHTIPRVAYNRYITLPDSSTVILHAGSTLEYPAAFSGNTRTVRLSGEAYFDIRPHRSPFVIHTGKITTTVLGTAFNIKAYPHETGITVSVTRGKVRVDDEQQLLGLLEHDQQMVYNTTAATARRHRIHGGTAIKWAQEDMVFNNETFATIAAKLEQRYQVHIRFDNEPLTQCALRASFDGTEPIEKVLDVLCMVHNAGYTITEDGHILISGEGCPPVTSY